MVIKEISRNTMSYRELLVEVILVGITYHDVSQSLHHEMERLTVANKVCSGYPARALELSCLKFRILRLTSPLKRLQLSIRLTTFEAFRRITLNKVLGIPVDTRALYKCIARVEHPRAFWPARPICLGVNEVARITNSEVSKACFVHVGKVNHVTSVEDTTARLCDERPLRVIDTQRRSIGILFETPYNLDFGRKSVGEEKKDGKNGLHLGLVVDEVVTDGLV
jgi:hypothetical protein